MLVLRRRYIIGSMTQTISPTSWQASLRLRFVREGARTLARERIHSGPLRLLKTHYPEGDGVAHAVIVHPPAGIVSGDQLEIAVAVESAAHAVITTPGAQKWYRAHDLPEATPARAHTHLRIAEGATLEWLPMESMIYDGCVGEQQLNFAIARGGKLLAWEMQQWGRSARGETFTRGTFSQRIAVTLGEDLAWTETMHLSGGGALLTSPTGLAGMPCVGTIIVVGVTDVVGCLEKARACCEGSALATTSGATSPFASGIVIKAVASEMETLRTLFVQLREIVRPFLCARDAVGLRVWAT